MKYISYMTKLKANGQEIILLKNDNPIEAFEKLGVGFDCHTGICGICKIKILKGENNLNPKTDTEQDYPLNDKERLACQCQKIKGDIEFKNADF